MINPTLPRLQVGHNKVYGKPVSYLMFLMEDALCQEVVDGFDSITAIAALVSVPYWLANKSIEDTHISVDLPDDIRAMLGGEIMDSHFEVEMDLGIFIQRMSEIGVLYMGNVR